MIKIPRIDRINLRNSWFGVMGIVYSDWFAWAVLDAPNTRVTESLVRKTWHDNHRTFWRWNDDTNDFIHWNPGLRPLRADCVSLLQTSHVSRSPRLFALILRAIRLGISA